MIGLDLNEEIAAVELRIHSRKQRLLADARALQTAAKQELTSPSILLFAAGLGFAIGKLTEGARAPGQSRLARMWAAIHTGAKAAVSVVHMPSLVWLARLFGTKGPTTRSGDDTQSHGTDAEVSQ